MDLETPEVEHTLDAEIASIDVVSQEKVASLCRVSSDLEQLHQIVVLAVNITTNSDGGIHLQQIGLSSENLGPLVDNP